MKRNVLFGLLLLVVGVGCNPRLRVPYWRPAEVNLRGVSQLAVGGVYGYGSYANPANAIKGQLEEAIFNSGRFQLVDRTHTEKVLAEVAFQNSGLVDDSKAASLGRLFPASALIFGNVTDYSEGTRVDQTNSWTDDKGVTHYTYTRTTWANVGASFQVIDCETGRVLAIKNLRVRKDAQTSGENPQPPYIDPGPLYDAARDQVVGDFMKVIAPYQDYANVVLYKDRKIPQLETGVNYIRVGNWAEGIKVFEEAYAAYPLDHRIMYNLGVAYEYTNQFELALPLLEKAYATHPTNSYQAEIANCKRLEEERKKLEAQMNGQ